MENVLVLLAVVFVAGRVGGEISERLRQPAVIGEIVAGIILGSAVLGIIPTAEEAPEAIEGFSALSELGVIFLLFTAGLETNLRSLRRVGATASVVALGGITLPFLGGLLLMRMIGAGTAESLVVATAMVATSVGATVRVLRDRGKFGTMEAQVILAAAVLDDVLGLMVLAVVVGVVKGQFSIAETALAAGLAVAFIVVFLTAGRATLRRIFPFLINLKATEPVLAVAIAGALLLAASAHLIGLAPIIGAFIAGVIFAEIGGEHDLEQKIRPLALLLVPFFFVRVGSLVEPDVLTTADGLLLVGGVTAVAILTKVAGCGLPALRLGRKSAAIVGVGMTPRGEVGIIVASIGFFLGAIPREVYGVIVMMSLLTTLVAPPVLVWLYGRLREADTKTTTH